MSLWSVVRCNSCGITSEAAETDSDADDKARKAGWAVAWQRTPVARAEAEGPGSTLHKAATAKALDFCVACRETPRTPADVLQQLRRQLAAMTPEERAKLDAYGQPGDGTAPSPSSPAPPSSPTPPQTPPARAAPGLPPTDKAGQHDALWLQVRGRWFGELLGSATSDAATEALVSVLDAAGLVPPASLFEQRLGGDAPDARDGFRRSAPSPLVPPGPPSDTPTPAPSVAVAARSAAAAPAGDDEGTPPTASRPHMDATTPCTLACLAGRPHAGDPVAPCRRDPDDADRCAYHKVPGKRGAPWMDEKGACTLWSPRPARADTTGWA